MCEFKGGSRQPPGHQGVRIFIYHHVAEMPDFWVQNLSVSGGLVQHPGFGALSSGVKSLKSQEESEGSQVRLGQGISQEIKPARSTLTVLPPLPITRPAVEEGTLMWASSFTSSLGLKKFSSFSFPKIRPWA